VWISACAYLTRTTDSLPLDKQGKKKKVESLPELQLADHLISQRNNTYQQFPHHYLRDNAGGENNYHTVSRYGYNRPRLSQIIQEESERRYKDARPLFYSNI